MPPHGYDLRYETLDGRILFVVRFMPDGTKLILDGSGTCTRTLARRESLNRSKRDRAKLVLSRNERVEIIKQIFRRYTEQGRGYKSIADTLNRQDIPTPRGPQWSHIYSGKWTDTTVRSILVNPVYTGDLVWNRRTDGRFHQIREGQAVERQSIHGHRLVPNNERDWIVVRDAHPPIVSRRAFQQAKQRRQNHPSSIEQRGRNPRTKAHGRTWNGQRSRFILSGLCTCGFCGSRYQGVTRHKGKPRIDGTRVITRCYGCGGHITKGNKVCRMNAISQAVLEEVVINAVLDFYRPYLTRGGKRKLADAVKELTGAERKDHRAARKRAEAELQRIAGIINNLLDNITPANRDLVDTRLKELADQRRGLESRLDELDRLTTSQAELQALVGDAQQFLSGLEFTLRKGVPQEKLVALRQCTERIHIDASAGQIAVSVNRIPCSGFDSTQQLVVALP